MNSNYQNNETKLKIELLVDNSIQVLQITNQNGEEYIFAVKGFEPPQTNSIGSSPFFQFRGIEITDFLKNNVYNQASLDTFIYSYQNFLQKSKERDYKFSQSYNWILFY